LKIFSAREVSLDRIIVNEDYINQTGQLEWFYSGKFDEFIACGQASILPLRHPAFLARPS
jgi:hypothetical protein